MNPRQHHHPNSFLPDFCGVRMVFVVVLIAELLAIILTLAEANYTHDHFTDLALKSLYAQWIALACIAVLCVMRPWFSTLPDHWAALSSYLVVLGVSLGITELAWWLLHAIPVLTSLINQNHSLFLLRCMGTSAIVGALALRYFYVRHQWRRNIESAAEARIQALQSRIRPHFLFNCMNTIASLTRTQPALAEEAIEDLSDLFRVSLQDAKSLTTWARELELCHRYLRIEEHRLGNRLQVNWQVEDVPQELQIPALTLQPLLENAIYHGIETLAEGGCIQISGAREGRNFRISVTNPLPPAGHQNHHDGNQLAQGNIQQRLQAFFGDRGTLQTTVTPDHYIASITIPDTYEDTDR